MILRHKFSNFYVQFTPIDWDSGAAKAIMEYLKSLPTGSKSYIPTMKEWRVDKKKAPDALKEVFRINQEYIKKMNEPDPDDFDAKKWLDETFGEKKKDTI